MMIILKTYILNSVDRKISKKASLFVTDYSIAGRLYTLIFYFRGIGEENVLREVFVLIEVSIATNRTTC
jgi:hypothetical protein